MTEYSLSLDQGGFLQAANNNAYNFGTGDFTLEAWIKPIQGGPIISRKSSSGGSNNGGFILNVNPDGSFTFATDSGFGYWLVNSQQTSVLDGFWHHVAACRHDTTLSLLVDGEQIPTSVAKTLSSPANVNNSLRLLMGAVDQTQQPYQHYTGMLSEIRIWNTARTSQQIADNFTSHLLGSEPGLVGYWRFTDELMTDFSKTGNSVRVNGPIHTSTMTPPIRTPATSSLALLFTGEYQCAMKFGGISGVWNAAGTLVLTADEVVVFNGKVIWDAEFKGNGISWSTASGNSSSASITFQLSGAAGYYWPTAVPRHVFQGWTQSGSDGRVDFRGEVTDKLSPCRFIQSISNGMVMTATGTTVGSQIIMQQKVSGTGQHFCFTDDNHIRQMSSQLALAYVNNALSLQTPSERVSQRWKRTPDGYYCLLADETQVLAVDSADRVVVVTKNENDSKQLWVSYITSIILHNDGADLVVQNNGNGASPTVQNKDRSMMSSQHWYFTAGYIINDSDGRVLQSHPTNPSQAIVGQMQANNNLQKWRLVDGQVINNSTNRALDITASKPGGTVVLNQSVASKTSQQWSTQEDEAGEDPTRPSAIRASKPRALMAAAGPPDTYKYKITVKTSNSYFSGTDDKFAFILTGAYSYISGSFSKSETNSDPLERGQEDVFSFISGDIGQIKEIQIMLASFNGVYSNLFGGDEWDVDYILIYDPVRSVKHSIQLNGRRVGGAMSFNIPAVTPEPKKVVLSTGIYPSWKGPRGVITRRVIAMDHSFAKATGVPSGDINFGCAGGYEGDGQQHAGSSVGIVTSRCSLSNLILFTTGRPLGPDNQLKHVYGYNNSIPAENCGISPGEYENWDGQCHQITNRLLYVCDDSPVKTLGDSSVQVHAYNISCMMFGTHGLRFADYCKRIGFPMPVMRFAEAVSQTVRTGMYKQGVSTSKYAEIQYAVNKLQGGNTNDPNNDQLGDNVRTFVKELKGVGMSETQIANFTNLDDFIVEKDEL